MNSEGREEVVESLVNGVVQEIINLTLRIVSQIG